jgi:hypothetical protein
MARFEISQKPKNGFEETKLRQEGTESNAKQEVNG